MKNSPQVWENLVASKPHTLFVGASMNSQCGPTYYTPLRKLSSPCGDFATDRKQLVSPIRRPPFEDSSSRWSICGTTFSVEFLLASGTTPQERDIGVVPPFDQWQNPRPRPFSDSAATVVFPRGAGCGFVLLRLRPLC